MNNELHSLPRTRPFLTHHWRVYYYHHIIHSHHTLCKQHTPEFVEENEFDEQLKCTLSLTSISLRANFILSHELTLSPHIPAPPRMANCTLFCQGGFVPGLVSSSDPRSLWCKRRVWDFHRAKIVEFVSFAGAFTSKYVVNPVKETWETVHSIPKETCQKVTRFDEPYKNSCFGGGPGEINRRQCGWCRVVQICGALACLSYDLLATPQGACSAQKIDQKMDRVKIALRHGLSNPRGRTWSIQKVFRTFSSGKTETRRREHSV